MHLRITAVFFSIGFYRKHCKFQKYYRNYSIKSPRGGGGGGGLFNSKSFEGAY